MSNKTAAAKKRAVKSAESDRLKKEAELNSLREVQKEHKREARRIRDRRYQLKDV